MQYFVTSCCLRSFKTAIWTVWFLRICVPLRSADAIFLADSLAYFKLSISLILTSTSVKLLWRFTSTYESIKIILIPFDSRNDLVMEIIKSMHVEGLVCDIRLPLHDLKLKTEMWSRRLSVLTYSNCSLVLFSTLWNYNYLPCCFHLSSHHLNFRLPLERVRGSDTFEFLEVSARSRDQQTINREI